MRDGLEKEKSTNKKGAVNMFFSGVIILTLANVLVKSMGLVSKIVLNTVVGSAGAGYYSSAYEIYAFLYIIATSGLPVALSIMVSRCRAQGKLKEARKIYNIALFMFLIIGGFFAGLMIIFSKEIASFISAPQTSICIVAVAPTILFISLSSCLRGYFQGFQLMKPTGVSQFLEALGKVGIGVVCALWAKSQGYDDHIVAAYTILGVTAGVFFGMVFLFVRKAFFKDTDYYDSALLKHEPISKDGKSIFKELIKIAIPITLSSCVLSLTIIIDTFMIQSRLLVFGMSEDLVRVFYGDYTTLVISLINLPTILIYPITNALVPLITAAIVASNKKKVENMRALALRIVNLISIPSALLLGVFSHGILKMLMFSDGSVERAAPWLSIGSASVIFLGLISVTNAFLNTAGKQRYPIISMLCGAGVKIIANYILLAKIGIVAAPISTILCYLTAATLNILFTVKFVGRLPNLKNVFGTPLLCSLVSISLSAILFALLKLIISEQLATFISIICLGFLYIFLAIRTKAITEEELNLIPFGKKIVYYLKKFRFFAK